MNLKAQEWCILAVVGTEAPASHQLIESRIQKKRMKMVRSIVVSVADEDPKEKLNDAYSLDEAIEQTSNKFLEISFLNKSDFEAFKYF